MASSSSREEAKSLPKKCYLPENQTYKCCGKLDNGFNIGHEDDCENNHECPHCLNNSDCYNKNFPSWGNLRYHLEQCFELRCQYCGIRIIDNPNKIYVKQPSEITNTELHELKCKNKYIKPIRCPHCGLMSIDLKISPNDMEKDHINICSKWFVSIMDPVAHRIQCKHCELILTICDIINDNEVYIHHINKCKSGWKILMLEQEIQDLKKIILASANNK